MKVMIVKEVMTGDVSPVAMFNINLALFACSFVCFLPWQEEPWGVVLLQRILP